MEYRFLLENIKTENATFLYKTVLSKTNVKTNEIGSTKLTFHQEQSFPTYCSIFLKI